MNKKQDLFNRIASCKYQLKTLMSRIDTAIATIDEKSNVDRIAQVSEIKIIREDITKVNQEIDNIKKEINLLNGYQVN
jgi:uncharacterized coiled-coil DUF342 family protein